MKIKSIEGKLFFPEQLFKVRGYRKDTVAINLLHAVEQVIENTYGVVAHADFIQIRKANCCMKIHLCKVFGSIVELSACISGWILNHQQVIGDHIYNLHGIILFHGMVFAKLWYLFA
ncbi:hypothetical protein DSECCO2_595080 [anaerobic digester metagenome]